MQKPASLTTSIRGEAAVTNAERAYQEAVHAAVREIFAIRAVAEGPGSTGGYELLNDSLFIGNGRVGGPIFVGSGHPAVGDEVVPMSGNRVGNGISLPNWLALNGGPLKEDEIATILNTARGAIGERYDAATVSSVLAGLEVRLREEGTRSA